MKAVLLKRLFSAVEKESERDLLVICKNIVEDEERLGHAKLAHDLQKTLETVEKRKAEQRFKESPASFLTSLPFSKRDAAALVQVIGHEKLRHHMVLSSEVEQQLSRIEKEYAARSRLATYGLHARKRILLYGPPGCGKSLGAERLAWTTGLPLFRVRFDTLISSFFGETAFNLSKVFEAAQKQPCALFLDECDTIATSRGKSNDVGEASRVVNMLLQLLEDYKGEGLVIAATNHYKALDKAIFRRFDEVVEIPKPGIAEIARLLQRTLAALQVEKDINFESFAGSLDGFSFSEVERIARNAAKRCVMANRMVINLADLQAASREVKIHF